MISILILGKSGASLTNDKYLSNAIEVLSLENSITIYRRSNFYKNLLNIRRSQFVVIWMENHLSLVVQILLFLTCKKCRILIHNPPAHKQTKSIYINLLLDFIQYISRKLTSEYYYLSENTWRICKGKWPGLVLSKVFPIEVTNTFINKQQRSIDIAFLGRNIDYKGLDIFAESLKAVNKKIKVVIAGEGVLKKNLYLNLKIDLEIIDSYLSEDDYYKFLEDAKYIVLPYTSVSQSGPLADAYAHNCSVLCSDLDYFKLHSDIGDIAYFKNGDPSDLYRLICSLDFENWKPVFINNKHSWEIVLLNLIRLNSFPFAIEKTTI